MAYELYCLNSVSSFRPRDPNLVSPSTSHSQDVSLCVFCRKGIDVRSVEVKQLLPHFVLCTRATMESYGKGTKKVFGIWSNFIVLLSQSIEGGRGMKWSLVGFRSTVFCSRDWDTVGNSGTSIYRTTNPPDVCIDFEWSVSYLKLLAQTATARTFYMFNPL